MNLEIDGNVNNSAQYALNMAKILGLTVTDGQRSLEQELALGGSNKGMHITGQAYDFSGSKDSMKRMKDWAMKSGLFTEILYGNDGHFDHIHLGWGTGKHKDGYAYVGNHQLIPTGKNTGKDVLAGGGTTPQVDTPQNDKGSGMLFQVTKIVIIAVFIILAITFFMMSLPATNNIPVQVTRKVTGGSKRGTKKRKHTTKRPNNHTR